MHRYKYITIHTRTSLALMAESLCPEEAYDARQADANESETERCWRRILQGHVNIRYSIHEIRKALYDMGAGLSPRACRYINAMKSNGYRWYDPRPDLSLLKAQKNLANAMAEMSKLWHDLYAAEETEKFV